MKKIFPRHISKIYKDLTKLSKGKSTNSFLQKRKTQLDNSSKKSIHMASRLIKSIHHHLPKKCK